MKFPSQAPVVVGSVISGAGLRLLGRAAVPADAVEVRVDALLAEGVALGEIETALERRRHPVLLTLRIPAEGGQRAWTVPERRELFLRLLPWVEAIDVELATASALGAVTAEAERLGKTVVYSAHAIAKPATAARFAGWEARFRPGPGRILKVASRIAAWRDLQRLAAVLVNHPDWAVAVMGLGPQAGRSRAVLAALGSRLVYGYLDRPAAPGQPSAAEVRGMVRGLGAVGT
jgi:3-dehydroquinate dehydratase-1